jgi:hypothetical protein
MFTTSVAECNSGEFYKTNDQLAPAGQLNRIEKLLIP